MIKSQNIIGRTPANCAFMRRRKRHFPRGHSFRNSSKTTITRNRIPSSAIKEGSSMIGQDYLQNLSRKKKKLLVDYAQPISFFPLRFKVALSLSGNDRWRGCRNTRTRLWKPQSGLRLFTERNEKMSEVEDNHKSHRKNGTHDPINWWLDNKRLKHSPSPSSSPRSLFRRGTHGDRMSEAEPNPQFKSWVTW